MPWRTHSEHAVFVDNDVNAGNLDIISPFSDVLTPQFLHELSAYVPGGCAIIVVHTPVQSAGLK